MKPLKLSPIGNIVNQKLCHILFGISDITAILRVKRCRDVAPTIVPIRITGRALTKERGKNRSLQTCKGLKIRMSEEEACAQTYGSGETPCRSLPHIHAPTRASLAEETLTTLRNKLTYPAEVHQLLSLATPVLAQWLHKQSGSGAQDRGNTWIQNLGTRFSRRVSGLSH